MAVSGQVYWITWLPWKNPPYLPEVLIIP